MQNLADSIQGFEITVTPSRPDLLQFIADTTIDTCFECLDSACLTLDTTVCTLEVVPSSIVGSLVRK